MNVNMGVLDRTLRALVVAPVAIVLAFVFGAASIAGVILFVVAGIMLATSVVGFCPTYTVLGISTDHGGHRVGHGLRHGHA
jgi:Inner membrane protein YgaP-like, transmembrane domain